MPFYLLQRFVLFSLIIAAPAFAPAQKKKDEKKDAVIYKEEAETLRKEVWGWSKPEFNVRTIPAEYANSSKVIIARHQEISVDSKKKKRSYTELLLLEIVREAIKVNDKSSVAEHSEIEFTQLERSYFLNTNNTTKVFVGIRIIKPDGSMKEINPDDVVLTRNESTKKEAKLAIPDLQVGDIIDYFIAKKRNLPQVFVDDNVATYTFSLFDDAPIMNYSIHCEMGKKFAVEYRCYNGAQDFKTSKGEDDDNILDIVKKNIPTYSESGLWTAIYRQLPIIRMNILVGSTSARKPGEVYKNQSAGEFVEDKKNSIAYSKRINYQYKLDMGIIGDYYKNVMKNKKNMTPDSLLKEMYYMYRFRVLLDVGNGDFESVVNRHNLSYNENVIAFNYGYFLNEADIENKLVLLTARQQPAMNEIMNSNEISLLLATQSPAARIFSFDDLYAPFSTIPYYFENAKQTVTLDIKGRKEYNSKDFDEGKMDLPGTTADKNARIENLALSLSSDGTTLAVNRTTTLKGYYKRDVQKQLILFEDYHAAERKIFGVQQTLFDQMNGDKKTKKFGEELQTAFDLARAKNKDAFKAEAKEWFEQEITELTDHKVVNMGVRHTKPDFVYSSKFRIGGLVKKAGNNYIIDIGKLQGSPLQIKPDQRKRTLDIYMPFARSLQTDIIIQIPDGYTAEGITNLNKKVENETGYFIVEASTDGKTVNIKIRKSYNKAFEPASNWEKLLSFIDAANEWSNAKILFKKK
jgi:hypothetical protein